MTRPPAPAPFQIIHLTAHMSPKDMAAIWSRSERSFDREYMSARRKSRTTSGWRVKSLPYTSTASPHLKFSFTEYGSHDLAICGGGGGERGGGGGGWDEGEEGGLRTFIACLSRLTIYRESLPRRRAVPTHTVNRNTSDSWPLSKFLRYTRRDTGVSCSKFSPPCSAVCGHCQDFVG